MSNWEEKAKIALDQRDASLGKVQPAFAGLPDPLPLSSQELPAKYLSARELELTEKYDAIELLDLLRSKKLTCEELTKAFLRRAALSQYAVRREHFISLGNIY